MTTLTLLVPLYQARHLLPRVLPPLLEAVERGEALELLVVDDGSTDGGPEYCEEQGATVLSSGGRLGPGGARNVGSKVAKGDVLLFVDSDVVMQPDVPGIVRGVFEENPDCVSVFGSYDDTPAAPGFVSQYVNLRHHYIHHHGNEEASTFWAGLGAVRREVFVDIGGFDLERYPYPSIEDIELGHRLRKRGRILLRPAMQGKHLKGWTLRNLVFTDIFRRAIPWTRLMLEPGYESRDLNTKGSEQAKALLALFFWASLLGAPLFPWSLAGTGLLFLLAFLVNRGLFQLILAKRGLATMLVAVLLHQLYYTYGVASFAYGQLEARVRPRRSSAASATASK